MITFTGYVSEVSLESAQRVRVVVTIPGVPDETPYSQTIRFLVPQDHEPRVGRSVQVNLEFGK